MERTTRIGGKLSEIVLPTVAFVVATVAAIIYIMEKVFDLWGDYRQLSWRRRMDAAQLKLNNDRQEARDVFDLWWETDGKLTAEQFARSDAAMPMTSRLFEFEEMPDIIKEAIMKSAQPMVVDFIHDQVGHYAIHLLTKLSLERVQDLARSMAVMFGDQAKFEATMRNDLEHFKHHELSLIEWGYNLEQFQAHFTQQPAA